MLLLWFKIYNTDRKKNNPNPVGNRILIIKFSPKNKVLNKLITAKSILSYCVSTYGTYLWCSFLLYSSINIYKYSSDVIIESILENNIEEIYLRRTFDIDEDNFMFILNLAPKIELWMLD